MPAAPVQPTSTTSHPAFVTIAIRPSARVGMAFYTIIRNADKEKYFGVRPLTRPLGVLPVRQRKGLWVAAALRRNGAMNGSPLGRKMRYHDPSAPQVAHDQPDV